MFILVIFFAGCSKFEKDLTGAGATFPQPLYQKMFLEFEKETGSKINYLGIGSGGGLFRLKEKDIDFAATDIILKDLDSNDILYIPTCVGAVAIVYNLPAKPQLKLTPEILADIFMGNLKNWNDEKISQLNPDIVLPNQRILIINRSDESGTSRIFNDYLGKVIEKWQNRKENPLKKFFDFSVRNNKEMANLISDTAGSIGFISLTYAIKNNMSFASIKNSNGNYILPSMVSVSAAAEIEIPQDAKIYLTNTNAEFGYPISSFSWIAVNKNNILNERKRILMKKLFSWMITKGQNYAATLNFAPLPPQTALQARKIIEKI